MANLNLSAADPAQVYAELEERLTELVSEWLEQVDPGLPVVLTAHASVQGAVYGGERSVMLGGDLVLPGSLVNDPRLNYVALGHIHKPQDLNQGSQPPVIYPGSIERVDFGEVEDDKFFVIADVERGRDTRVEWRKLEGIRPFHRPLCPAHLLREYPRAPAGGPAAPDELDGAILRMIDRVSPRVGAAAQRTGPARGRFRHV